MNVTPLPVRPFPANIALRTMTRTPAPRFEGEGAVKSGGVASLRGGALALAIGLGTFIYGQSSTRHYQAPSPAEQAMAVAHSQMKSKVVSGSLFDKVSDGIKRGAWRFITGERSSPERMSSGDFKMMRNASETEEDYLFVAAALLTDSPDTRQALKQACAKSMMTRDAYFDNLKYLTEVHLDEAPAGNVITRWWKDRKKAKVEAAIQAIDSNDRVVLRRLFEETLGQQQGPLTSAQACKLYDGIVEKIVAKHAPQDLERCREAGKTLFASEGAYFDGRTSEVQKRAAMNRYAEYMGGFGLLALMVGGALSSVAAAPGTKKS